MSDRTSLVASSGVITDGGVGPQEWGDGVSLRAFDWNVDPARLVYDTQFVNFGFGVAGGLFDQIDFSETRGNVSERVEIDFGGPVSDVEITFAQMNSDERGVPPDDASRVETGKWTAYDDAGDVVAEGRLDPKNSTLGEYVPVPGTEKVFPLALATDETFSKVAIEATGFDHGEGDPIIETRKWQVWRDVGVDVPFEQNTDFNINKISYVREPDSRAASADGSRTEPSPQPETTSPATDMQDPTDVTYDVVASSTPDRAAPFDLDGAQFDVGEPIYAFVANDDGNIANVEFTLDGTSIQKEWGAPWDIRGDSNGAAAGLDTTGLAAGDRVLETIVTYDGGGARETTTLTDTFTLADDGGGTAGTSGSGDTAGIGYDVVASSTLDRAAPFDLDGAQFDVGEPIYAFVANDDGNIANVEFLLEGTRIQREFLAPWDIVGGTKAEAAGFDTTGLAADDYELRTVVTYEEGGATETTTLTDVFTLVA